MLIGRPLWCIIVFICFQLFSNNFVVIDGKLADSNATYLAERKAEAEWFFSMAESQGSVVEHQDQNDQKMKDKIVGKIGVNYELDGTDPYLTCAYLNKTECDPAVRSDCRNTTKCFLDGVHRQLGCIGVFQVPEAELMKNKSAQYVTVKRQNVEMMGCLLLTGDAHSDFCSETECRSTTSRLVASREGETIGESKPNDRRFGSCCCLTKECNLDGLEMVNPHFDPQNGTNDEDEEEVLTLIDEEGKKDDEMTTTIVEKPDSSWVTLTEWVFGVSTFIMLAAMAFCVTVGYRHINKKTKPSKTEESLLHHGPIHQSYEQISEVEHAIQLSALRRHDLHDVVLDPPKWPVTDLLLITHGRFGQVFRGKLLNPDGTSDRTVAVKKHCLSERISYEAEKAIFDELYKYPAWYDPILKCVGTEQVGRELCIITEFHRRLSLFELLRKNRISRSSGIRIVLSMLDGLQFLHDERPFYFPHVKAVIIHRDIKSKNVLVRDDMTACLADFGLARIFDFNLRGNADLLGQVGTRRYMSPEVLEGATEFTASAFKQMDVYAMGLVVWEVLSRVQLDRKDIVPEFRLPYEEDVGTNPHIGQMRSVVVTRKKRPLWRQPVVRNQPFRGIRDIAEEMWDPEASGRITAGCAFEKTWQCILEYTKMQARLRGEPIPATDPMVLYHKDSTNNPYPTPDPFLDYPLPPPFPILEPEKTNSDIDSDFELYFNLEKGRQVSPDESEENEHLWKSCDNSDVIRTPPRENTC